MIWIQLQMATMLQTPALLVGHEPTFQVLMEVNIESTLAGNIFVISTQCCVSLSVIIIVRRLPHRQMYIGAPPDWGKIWTFHNSSLPIVPTFVAFLVVKPVVSA